MDVLGAVRFGSFDDVLEIKHIPQLPKLNPKEVLIKVAYSDVNPVDLQKLKGKEGQPVPNPPFVPGYGGSGIVQEVGSAAPQHLSGKQVCFLADPTLRGSYASHIVVDCRCIAEVPPNVDLRDAASIPVAGLTAYECLVKLGLASDIRVQDGNIEAVGLETNPKTEKTKVDATASLLVVGGSGGVGSWIIVLARTWHPHLKIIVTASPEAEEWCKSLGATQVIRHDQITKVLSGGQEGSVSSIICLAEPTPTLFNALSEVIQPYGQICLVVSGKSIEGLNLGFCFYKCVNVLTETVFSSIRSKYQHIVPAEELKVILGLMANQTIKAPLSPDLEGVSEKFRDAIRDKGVLKVLAGPHRRGKLVMLIHGVNELIFLDLKTASLIKIPRKDCLEKKVLSKVKGGDVWQEESQTSTERDELIKKMTSNPRLGISKVAEKQWKDYEDGIEMQEAENVKNLWGVQLKKREKNVKGEELLFVDPSSRAVGELSRKKCIESGLITLSQDEEGKEIIHEAVIDAEERDGIIQTVRQTLKLYLEVS